VFLTAVFVAVVVGGTVMYVVEGPQKRLLEHPDLGVLGGDDDDHGRLRRHHAEDRLRPPDRELHDAARWGVLAVPTASSLPR
jgi:hypothetical protein